MKLAVFINHKYEKKLVGLPGFEPGTPRLKKTCVIFNDGYIYRHKICYMQDLYLGLIYISLYGKAFQTRYHIEDKLVL